MSASYEAGRKWRAAPRRQRCSAPVVISSAIFLLHLAASEANASLDYYHSHQTNGFNNIFGKNELPPPGSSEQVEIGGSGGTIGDELSNGCPSGLLTFELSTGFIYKPTSAETLAMMPSTLQLTDCLDYCLHNATCLAINFEMGLCVLLSSSAKQNPANLYSSQFPVFTIYAEKKCLLSADPQVAKQRRRCQRAWTFERVAGYEMKTPPRRRLKLASKEHCMEACLSERDFECRSANWYRSSGECTLSEQDRHSVSQSEAGDQHIKASLLELYGPSNLTAPTHHTRPPTLPAGLYQNYYEARSNGRNLSGGSLDPSTTDASRAARSLASRFRELRQLAAERLLSMAATATPISVTPPAIPRGADWASAGQYVLDMPANALVDYLENNCVYEPNKLCEFRKIQNRVLKTVDSIYQDVNSLDECKQKCLNAPYRCYSFDYGETVDRVCRTSHLDQASLLSVKEPYLDVAGAITYELASCFNVSIQCRAKEMVAQVSSSKTFRGKIYVKSRPSSCVNDVKEALRFELSMRYHDEACDVRASSNSQQGVFSNEIIIQHHDRIVTTQDVGLSVYCQYDLGNKSITNNVDLAIERIEDGPLESKNQASAGGGATGVPGGSGSINSPLTITSLATTVVRSPNVTMRITNMGGQPVASATVGDRLALLFEIKEKTSPFGIFVREIIAMDGRQVLATAAASSSAGKLSTGSRGYHYANGSSGSEPTGGGGALAESLANVPATPANSIQFIDAHGCPTDANIMGPLVKMDPSGHRVLAPFDAFKFPTSDVVFFRAVVSSCVAECQPVQCAGPDGQPLETGGYPSSLAGGSTISPALLHSSTLASGFPTTLTDLTLLQQQISSSSRRPLIAETRTSTAAPEAPPTTRWTAAFGQDISSAASAIATTLASPLSSTSGSQNRTKPVSSSGDSLTTVPGFASSGPSPDMWTLEETGGLVSTDSGQQQRHQQVNMTNNHQLGKAPPRPTVVPSPGQLQQQQPLLQLDKLTNLEKHQLVQLFESNLKQQSTVGGGAGNTDRMTGNGVGNNSSLAEMADFYSGFLTSVMLNNLNNNNNIENGALSSVADYKRTEKVAQQLAATGAGDDFLSPMALLEAAQRKTQPAGVASSNSASLLELQTLLGPYLLANRTDDIKAIVRALLERRTKVDSAAGHQPEVQPQAMPKQKQPADNLNDIVPVQQQQQQQPKSRSQQQQQHISGNNRTQHLQQRRSAAQEVVANKRKRDKASQLQAFADSYLGAHQTFGGRRRRRRRQVEEQVAAEDDEDNLETDDNFVAISEVPAATVAPPGASEGHFTRATVHMYRRRNQHLSEQRHRRHSRRKREALPRYEVDELVVQSIKIVDRLQFPEDGGVGTTNVRPAAAATATAGQKRRSPARKEPARQQQQPQQQHHPHQSAPLAGGDSGEPGESGEAREARALLTWSSSSVLSLILIALTFLFAQVFLVALCLLDWRRRRRPRPLAAARPILAPDSRSGSLDTLSSCGSSSAYSTATEARRSLPQYLLGEPRTSGRPPPPGTGRRAARFPRPLAPNGAGRAEMRRQQLRNGSSNSRYPAEIDGNHSPVAYNCQTLLHAHNHEPPQPPPPPPPPVDLKQTD